MKNITTTLKKLFYLWRRSQVPVKQPIKISRIDNLIIFLVCILISIISSYKLLLILPPSRDTTEEKTNKIKNKLLFIATAGSGQLKLAIETQAKAVMLPIPWDIINAGGTIKDNGLMVEAKANFVACTAKRRVMIKMICLEEIVGFSFFETNIKTPELISISVNAKNQEKISDKFKGEIRSSL